MEPISTEKKLELIKSIREDHAKNVGNMKQRERILFGTPPTNATPTLAYQEPIDSMVTFPAKRENEKTNFAGLKIRFFLAILLFVGFVILDMGKIEAYGINTSFIQAEINRSFSTNVFDFMTKFPYTLTEEPLKSGR